MAISRFYFIDFAVGFALIIIVAYFLSDYLIFLPPKPGYADNDQIIKIKTKNNQTIAAIYLRNLHAKYTLLVSHGNAEDIGHLMPLLKAMQQHGFSVFAYDYEGYGRSTGKASEKTSYVDVEAAYQYLVQTLKVPPNRVIAYGRSVGAALAIHIASQQPVAGVIAESPFVSVFRVITRIPILPVDKFNNLKKIKKLSTPILFIHGKADRIVPFWHSRKLYDAAQAPKQHFWVPRAGHNDILWVAGEQYWNALNQFVEMVDLSQP